MMKHLPINEILPQVKETFQEHSTLILQAPPGAGKSTVVPISLLNESWLGSKMIIMLEPRRVAARMVALQMAKLLGEEVGERVGYQIKMDSCQSAKTKILVVTEAILVRRLQSDQSLENVAMVIFDEFHERSIHTDLSLALSLQVQELLREDLKLLIMSATLNSKEISTLVKNAPILTSKGKMFDVENIYLEKNIKQPDYKSMNTVLLHAILNAVQNDSGDILVFLAGAKEIRKIQKSLSEELKKHDVLILPLYSALSKEDQNKAIFKNKTRKIILSTNIAQTSLTIEGVKVVIDTGLEKVSRYNYSNAMDHLEISFISQDSAIQRAGRAGRLSSGRCYKLWHQGKIIQKSDKPEILRADLSSVLLDLALWGVQEFDELQWLDIPERSVIDKTKEVLKELNMLDEVYNITAFGKEALSLGLHPRFSYMILEANELGYVYEACLLAALLGEKDIYKNSYNSSDILGRFTHLFYKDFNDTYIHSHRAREIIKQAEFFYSKVKRIKKIKPKNKKLNEDMISVLLLFAYPDRLAKLRAKNDNKYKLSNGKGAIIHQEDNLFNREFLVVSNLYTQNRDSTINLAISITLDQIETYFSALLQEEKSITYNKENKKFDLRSKKTFLDLELYSKPESISKTQEMKPLLLDLIQQEGLELLTWSKKALDLKNRVNFLRFQKSYLDKNDNLDLNLSLDLNNFSDESLLDNIGLWLEPYLDNICTIKELAALDLYSILLSVIPWEKQQVLDKLLPTHIKVPSGSIIKIDYSNVEIPILAVRLQEMFGLHETPRILNGLVPLQIHLLNPASQPIQITYDLKNFWENSYAEVRKELRGKYKRHYWPENPFEAIATNKTKKNLNLKEI